MEEAITETDWQRFDGFTPTFTHPALTPSQLQFLLGAAYTRFYMRPSFLANFLRIRGPWLRQWITALDARVGQLHARHELATMERSLS